MATGSRSGANREKRAQGQRRSTNGSGPPRDRHLLYEQAVQAPEADVQFFDRIFRAAYGRLPESLKEDFCGTAHLSCAWVGARAGNSAVGVDLHGPTLAYGRRHNVAPLGEAAERIQLLQANVLDVRKPKVDIVAALNFSYFVFHTREDLLRYFRTARASLAREGMFVVDIFGGWEAQQLTTETKRLDGFRYHWRQASFDPITNRTLFYIDFSFPDGTRMDRAFRYDWRFWTIPEVREVLAEAGFRQSEVYWEGTEARTGLGNGVFRTKERTRSEPGWIAYIAAR